MFPCHADKSAGRTGARVNFVFTVHIEYIFSSRIGRGGRCDVVRINAGAIVVYRDGKDAD